MEKNDKLYGDNTKYGDIFKEKVNNFNQQKHEEKEAKKLEKFVEVLAQ
jgi:hypothetical protein